MDRPRPYRGPDGQDAARRRAGVDASRRSLDRAAHRTCQYGSEKFARASRRHGLGVQQTRSRGGRGAVRRVYRPAARRTAVWRAAGRHTARQLGVRDADLDPGDGARVRPAERLCAAAVAAGRAGLCRGRSGGFGPLPARLARDDLGAFHGELLRHDGPPGPRERAVRHLRDGRRGRLPGRHPGIFQVRRRADVRVLAAVHRRVCGVAELQAGQADRLGGPALRQAARRGRGLHVVLPYVGRTLDDAQGDRQPPSVGRGDAFGLSYLYAQPAAALPAARHVVRRPGDRYALPARTDLVAPHARNQRLFRPVQLHAGAGMARVGRALVSGRRAERQARPESRFPGGIQVRLLQSRRAAAPAACGERTAADAGGDRIPRAVVARQLPDAARDARKDTRFPARGRDRRRRCPRRVGDAQRRKGGAAAFRPGRADDLGPGAGRRPARRTRTRDLGPAGGEGARRGGDRSRPAGRCAVGAPPDGRGRLVFRLSAARRRILRDAGFPLRGRCRAVGSRDGASHPPRGKDGGRPDPRGTGTPAVGIVLRRLPPGIRSAVAGDGRGRDR